MSAGVEEDVGGGDDVFSCVFVRICACVCVRVAVESVHECVQVIEISVHS